ncbi:MAG TPA: CoB--CoM heterodisulfide reductase iron-sulfur subunit B family protein [Armatimonadota bacterium]|nr:CoB--CoM heterodisulfide reductase iron-sulfur subunit B family protein [Armatimonadota bacterium]
MMMKIGYYPGCSLHATAKEFDLSTRAVCAAVGLELVEIEDWNCCGASAAHAISDDLAVGLAGRNLALAAQQGLDAVLAPCAACFGRLKYAAQHLAADGAELPAGLDARAAAGVRVHNILDALLHLAGLERIREAASKPLAGLRPAAYYGCLLVRPPQVAEFDDPENPTSMEQILGAVGAEPVEWYHRLECCGASLAVTNTPSAVRLVAEILGAAKAAGADCVAVACPMCQTNLDTRQAAAAARLGETLDLPIVYITELLGLAFGITPNRLGLGRHIVDAMRLARSS